MQGASSCVHTHQASVETLYTLLFHTQLLPGSHFCASKSDFLLHRPEVITLSYVDLGMFSQMLDINALLLLHRGLCLLEFGQQLS